MSSYTQWVAIEFAERWHCLRQGTLNVGNTQQNYVNLRTLARAQANAPSNPPWARWNSTLKNGTAQPIQALQVFPARVPGFKKPLAS